MKYKVLCVFGTRPEAIKMAPLVKLLQQHSDIDATVCVTAQHRQMLDQVLDLFEITPDFDLDIMKSSQSLSGITSDVLLKLGDVLQQLKPDRILVHGDTSTAMAASMAAFYHKIPVAHVEAGLRTGEMLSPWPEEMNRRVVSVLADMHFSPTQRAKDNLLKENVHSDQVLICGNTVIDSILWVVKKLKTNDGLKQKLEQSFLFLQSDKKLILVTAHRRENFGQGFLDICHAISMMAKNKNVQIIYPVHLNPNVQEPVHKILGDCDNVILLSPLDYLDFVYLMDKSYLILTDSGGIQEEAPSLGKPVLVMRDSTERQEAIDAGVVRLVGTDPKEICHQVNLLLEDKELYSKMSQAKNPFGNGDSAEKIVNHLLLNKKEAL